MADDEAPTAPRKPRVRLRVRFDDDSGTPRTRELLDCSEATPRRPRVRLDDTPARERIRVRVDDEGTATATEAAAAPAKRKKAARRMALTESRVAGLKIDKARGYLVWDHGNDAQRGLAVHVQPSGAKSYTAYYTFPGLPTKSIVIGRAGEMKLEAARKRTGEIRGKARQGI